MIHIERNQLGPRLYVLGRRVHEWHLGVVAGAASVIILALGLVDVSVAVGLLLVSAWLVVKDWRDLFPATRDTAAWRLGIHRRAAKLRAAPRGDWLPPLAGTIVAVTGIVNIVSTLTPNVEWRARLLYGVEPVEAIPVFHALALPLGAALLVAAAHLARRKRRAWQAAIAFLVLLGAFDLLKGLDVEEAALSWAVVGLLWWGRSAFYVQHDPVRLRSALWKLPAVVIGAFGLAFAAASAADPDAGARALLHEAFDLLTWSAGPERFGDELFWLPYGVGLVSAFALLAAAYIVFRPLAAPRSLPNPELRQAASELVARHGTDTLAYFKLRRDAHYLFSPDGRAFVGYRVESGVLLVSGDPVGPDDALPGLLREVCAFADARGLEVAALGASERTLSLWRGAGLRALYVGDEAIVDTRTFSLEGRGIRKVRQSVARLEKVGYRAELVRVEELGASTLDELERLSAHWRADAPERGFTMAMDCLRGEGGLLVIARDESGTVRGFHHYVPSASRPALSLSLMRRDKSTPNGLSEFLVVRSIELARELGVYEVSLNFAAFARLLHGPRNPTQRLLGRLLALANPFFQIESLYRFNAKFFPRWEPRYLVFGRARRLPRVGLAAMWIEGQLPKPAFRRAGRVS